MSTTIFWFNAVQDLGTAWVDDSLALVADEDYASNKVNETSWLSLRTATAAIPTTDTSVVGFEVEVKAGTHLNSGLGQTPGPEAALISAGGGPDSPTPGDPEPDTTYSLEIALSKDGSTPYGNTKFIDVFGYPQVFLIGSPTDLWGGTWSASEANAMAILIRRPSSSPMPGWTEDAVEWRRLDYGRVFVYHTFSGGSFTEMERESIKQTIHFGKESSKGSAATCTNRLMAARINPQLQGDFKGWRPQGNKNEQVQMLMREWATSPINGIPTYDEIGYLLASIIGVPQSNGGVVNTLNTHVFRLDNRYESDYQSYTFEYGTNDTRAHRATHGVVDSLNINFTRADADLGGSMLFHSISDGITMSGGVSEVQKLTPSGSPASGTIKLRFKGLETGAITFSTTPATFASNIQTALNAIATIGASGVSAAANGANVDITFSGTGLTGKEQPLLELSNNSLNQGTIGITEVTSGGYVEDTLIPILPGHVNIYISDTFAGLSSGKLTRARMSNFSIDNRYAPYWVMDTDNASFATTIEDAMSVKFNLELQANSNGMAFLTNARAGTGKFIRVEAVGPLISGSDYHTLTIDAYAKISAFGSLDDNEGVYNVSYEFTVAEEPTWNNSLVVTLKNGKIGY